MGFELHVFLGRSGNLLGHDLALLRIQLERCRDLCDNAAATRRWPYARNAYK